MKEIIINSKKYGRKIVLVDDDDFETMNIVHWYAFEGVTTFYARGKVKFNGKLEHVLMHRKILGLTDPKIKVDHVDHNGLNNQKYNLRIATHQQNMQNISSRRGSSSKYLGVTLNVEKKYKNERRKWLASIRVNGILKTISRHPYTEEGEIEAAKAYDKMAIKYFGEFANPNFK